MDKQTKEGSDLGSSEPVEFFGNTMRDGVGRKVRELVGKSGGEVSKRIVLDCFVWPEWNCGWR